MVGDTALRQFFSLTPLPKDTILNIYTFLRNGAKIDRRAQFGLLYLVGPVKFTTKILILRLCRQFLPIFDLNPLSLKSFQQNLLAQKRLILHFLGRILHPIHLNPLLPRPPQGQLIALNYRSAADGEIMRIIHQLILLIWWITNIWAQLFDIYRIPRYHLGWFLKFRWFSF